MKKNLLLIVLLVATCIGKLTYVPNSPLVIVDAFRMRAKVNTNLENQSQLEGPVAVAVRAAPIVLRVAPRIAAYAPRIIRAAPKAGNILRSAGNLVKTAFKGGKSGAKTGAKNSNGGGSGFDIVLDEILR